MLRLLKLAAMAKHDTGNEQPPDKRIAAAILVIDYLSFNAYSFVLLLYYYITLFKSKIEHKRTS